MNPDRIWNSLIDYLSNQWTNRWSSYFNSLNENNDDLSQESMTQKAILICKDYHPIDELKILIISKKNKLSEDHQKYHIKYIKTIVVGNPIHEYQGSSSNTINWISNTNTENWISILIKLV